MEQAELDEDEAVRWALRLEGEALSGEEDAELEAWLDEDERRGGLLLRAEATLAFLDRGRALAEASSGADRTVDRTADGAVDPAPDRASDQESPERVPPERAEVRPYVAPVHVASGGRAEPHHRRVTDRRRFLAGGAAAGLAAVFGGVMVWQFSGHPQEIATVVGEVRRLRLGDGSMASVNTASKLLVTMSEDQRRIELADGEAWFQVAHDTARPFVVEAGDVRVQAVGTAFSVRRREEGLDVLVTEGVVEAWVVGREATRIRIPAGNRSFVSEAAPAIEVKAAPDEVDRALAWRSGELALNGESLAYAASELNRYNDRKLVIDDPALAQHPLVGYFRTDEPEKFGLAVATMLDARVVQDGNVIRIVR